MLPSLIPPPTKAPPTLSTRISPTQTLTSQPGLPQRAIRDGESRVGPCVYGYVCVCQCGLRARLRSAPRTHRHSSEHYDITVSSPPSHCPLLSARTPVLLRSQVRNCGRKARRLKSFLVPPGSLIPVPSYESTRSPERLLLSLGPRPPTSYHVRPLYGHGKGPSTTAESPFPRDSGPTGEPIGVGRTQRRKEAHPRSL